jgi:hypothetical protein
MEHTMETDNRPETMNHVIMVLGDTSIAAFESSGILKANDNICAVLVSTERATVEALDEPGGFHSQFPNRVWTVYLKPAPTDFAQVPQRVLPWLTPRKTSQRLRGGAEGALDRADAATRILLSYEFKDALKRALIWAHKRRIAGINLAVGVIGFAVAGRMTGSGTLVASVDILEEMLLDFTGTADEVWIDLLIGVASIHQPAQREFEDAQIGSAALIAELGAALADPKVAGPSGLFGTHLGQIMVLGPQEGGGILSDVQEANASIQLALSAVVCGDSQRGREAYRPSANRTVNHRHPGAVFAGIGVLEVVFDRALASQWVARRILATMPEPTEPAHA